MMFMFIKISKYLSIVNEIIAVLLGFPMVRHNIIPLKPLYHFLTKYPEIRLIFNGTTGNPIGVQNKFNIEKNLVGLKLQK